jgi:glycerol 2-dehydrogenase (NADP+)
VSDSASSLKFSTSWVSKLRDTTHHKVDEGFNKLLSALGLDSIDLYLVHWPQAILDDGSAAEWSRKPQDPHVLPTIVETWKAMEALLDTGKVKSIGVSNYGIPLLGKLLPEAKIIPAVNQMEVHLCLPQIRLKD